MRVFSSLQTAAANCTLYRPMSFQLSAPSGGGSNEIANSRTRTCRLKLRRFDALSEFRRYPIGYSEAAFRPVFVSAMFQRHFQLSGRYPILSWNVYASKRPQAVFFSGEIVAVRFECIVVFECYVILWEFVMDQIYNILVYMKQIF